LDAIGAGPAHGQDIVEVWNKADLLSEEALAQVIERAEAMRDLTDADASYVVSCLSGEGIETLREGIETALTSDDEVLNLKFGPKDYAARAWVHQNGTILSEDPRRTGISEISVRLSVTDVGKFRARYPNISS